MEKRYTKRHKNNGCQVIPGVRLFQVYQLRRPGDGSHLDDDCDYLDEYQLYIDYIFLRGKHVKRGYVWTAPSFEDAFSRALEYVKNPKNKGKLHHPIPETSHSKQLSLF